MKKVVDTIKIEKLEGGAFNVVQENKYSDTLSYDEMLGLVSALTIAKEPNCLRWMQTKEEHERSRAKTRASIKESSELVDSMIRDLNSRVIPIMTNPLGKSWKQPSLAKLIFRDDYVLMDKMSFDILHNYETSYPSGVYEGKIWRSGGTLMWYDLHDTDKNLCTVKSMPIAITEPAISRAFPKPNKKSLWVRIAEKLTSKKNAK